MTYAEADPALRHRQARPALRPRDRGRDGGHARLGVRRLRGRRGGALPARAAGRSRAPSSATLEEIAKEWGAKGLAYLVYDEERRGALADREVPLRAPSSRRFARAPGDDAALRRRRLGRRSRACSARLRLHLGRELGLIDDDAFTFLWVTDFPMFEWDEDDGALDVRAPPVHARRPTSGEELFDDDPGDALAHAYDLIVERQRARRRLVPDPRARAPGTGLRRCWR